MFWFVYWFLLVPGSPFAHLLSKIKRIKNGTANEMTLLDFSIWSATFGIIGWLLVFFVGGIWLWNNF